MPANPWITEQALKSLARLLPRLEPHLPDGPERQVFLDRLEHNFRALFELLHSLYGGQYDFFYHLEQILIAAAQTYTARPASLKALDLKREADREWFQKEKLIGGVYYVDLLAGDLQGVREKIAYFRELGLTYLHLMPLFRSPQDNSDGGYAVSSYREVDPALGTMEELGALAEELRQNGISLVLDFVFNHTSHEHTWALAALNGDKRYQDFYFMFDDRTLPDQYERHLREIFPDKAPGNFTHQPETGQWVWTTFHTFQWDLNYANPEVFNAMMQEMLFLANQGVEVLRLDAVAFIWKQMGTTCESLPQVHQLIRAFNLMVRIVSPAMIFKSEAIIHPAEVASYIDWQEAPLSYNPTLMALLWEALATREVRLLRESMIHWFNLPEHCAWVNYIRSHDDIGWTFADEDAARLGINGYDHRQFLNRFYTGAFPGSFARGLPFGFNPQNQDMRISGTAASLAGVEQALELNNDLYLDHALKRIALMQGIIMSAGGIPLLYLGDEIGTLNDYSYQENPAKAVDSRWVHRPRFDWQRAAKRHDPATIEGRIFQRLLHLIKVRKAAPALANGKTVFFDTGNPHVLGYTRHGQILVLGNFSEHEQAVETNALAHHWPPPQRARDLVSGAEYPLADRFTLEPYGFVWLQTL